MALGLDPPTQSPNLPGWSDDKIIHMMSDVTTDPNANWTQQTGHMGAKFTRTGAPVKWKVEATRDGIDIVVIVEPDGRGIVTGYPTSPELQNGLVSGKKWNDPSLTEEEFVNDYKTRHSATTLSEDEIRLHYQTGQQLHPGIGRLRQIQ